MPPDDASAPPDDALNSASDDADQDFPSDPVGSTQSSCLTFIEIVVVDEDGNPVTKGKYRLVLTDGTVQEDDMPGDGRIRVDSIPHGTCDFKLYKMIDFGTPDEEVQRARDWDSSQGESPNVGSSETQANDGTAGDGGSDDNGDDSGDADSGEDDSGEEDSAEDEN